MAAVKRDAIQMRPEEGSLLSRGTAPRDPGAPSSPPVRSDVQPSGTLSLSRDDDVAAAFEQQQKLVSGDVAPAPVSSADYKPVLNPIPDVSQGLTPRALSLEPKLLPQIPGFRGVEFPPSLSVPQLSSFVDYGGVKYQQQQLAGCSSVVERNSSPFNRFVQASESAREPGGVLAGTPRLVLPHPTQQTYINFLRGYGAAGYAMDEGAAPASPPRRAKSAGHDRKLHAKHHAKAKHAALVYDPPKGHYLVDDWYGRRPPKPKPHSPLWHSPKHHPKISGDGFAPKHHSKHHAKFKHAGAHHSKAKHHPKAKASKSRSPARTPGSSPRRQQSAPPTGGSRGGGATGPPIVGPFKGRAMIPISRVEYAAWMHDADASIFHTTSSFPTRPSTHLPAEIIFCVFISSHREVKTLS